jgi:hypothetical protein
VSSFDLLDSAKTSTNWDPCVVPNQTDRGKTHLNFLLSFAQIVGMRTEGSIPSSLRTSQAAMSTWVQNTSTCTPEIRSHLAKVFTTFKDLLSESPETFQDNGYASAKNFAPVSVPGKEPTTYLTL